MSIRSKQLRPYLLIGALVGILLVAGLLLWGERYPVASGRDYAPVGPGGVYLALGDSLAWGATLENPDTQSYPALLQARLFDLAPIELVNLSVPGETSSSFVQRQLPQAQALIENEWAAGRRVSPITLDIGGNDLRAVTEDTPEARLRVVEAVGANLALILDMLQHTTQGRADIAVMTYYNPYGGDPNDAASEAYWVERLNSVIRVEAERRGVAVADTYAPFGAGRAYTYTNVLIGDIHANRQGHMVIADQFWSALEYDLP